MKNTLQNSAWLYDLDNRDLLTEDIPFYLEYAQCQGGEILELGAGPEEFRSGWPSQAFPSQDSIYQSKCWKFSVISLLKIRRFPIG